MRLHLRAIAAMAVLAAVAGCQSDGPRTAPPAARVQTGVEGQWIGTDRVAISTLQAGTFTSRSVETGEPLTRGSYVHKDARTIELTFFSLKSQQTITAACLQVSVNQMNCTLANGTNFVLTRHLTA